MPDENAPTASNQPAPDAKAPANAPVKPPADAAVAKDAAPQKPDVAKQEATKAEAKPAEQTKDKAESAKTGEEAKKEVKPAAPERYELKLPEGSLLGDTLLEKTASFAKERGFSNEHAQAVVEHTNSVFASLIEEEKKALEAQSEKWVESCRTGKFGGDAFKENAAAVERLVAAYGSQDFKELVNQTRLGNHPALWEFLASIAQASKEDKAVMPNVPTVTRQRSDAEVLFPMDELSMKQQEVG